MDSSNYCTYCTHPISAESVAIASWLTVLLHWTDHNKGTVVFSILLSITVMILHNLRLTKKLTMMSHTMPAIARVMLSLHIATISVRVRCFDHESLHQLQSFVSAV